MADEETRQPGAAAWLTAWAGRHRRWLLAGAVLLMLAGFNGQWHMSRDAALYATIGLNLSEGKGFTHPEGKEGRANPGLPCVASISFKLFGAHQLYPVLAGMMLCSLGVLFLTYRLLLRQTDGGTATLVTSLLGVSYTLHLYTYDVLTDVPFLFGAMLFLLGYEWLIHGTASPQGRDFPAKDTGLEDATRGTPRNTWGGMALGAAMLAAGVGIMAAFRLVVVIFIAAALIDLLCKAFQRTKQRGGFPESRGGWRIFVAVVAILFIALAVRLADPRSHAGGAPGAGPGEDGSFLTPKEQEILNRLGPDLNVTAAKLWHENLPSLLFSTTSTALLGNKLGIPPLDALIAVVAFVGGTLLLGKQRVIWGALIALFGVQWLLFLPGVRYFLPILPLLAYAWWLVTVRLDRAIAQPWGGRVAILCLTLWFGMNLPRTLGLVIEQRRVPFYQHFADGRFEGVAEFGRLIERETPPDAMVVAPQGVRGQLGFYSRRLVVSPERVNVFSRERVYFCQPDDPAVRELLETERWTVGREVAAMKRPSGREAWRLVEVEQ